MKEKIFLLLLFFFLFLSFFFQKQIAINTKILLFISEQFPIPIKPLGLVTSEPLHQKIEFQSENGKVVGDLFLPSGEKKPAVIVAMGVKTSEKDKPLLISLGKTLARLDYIVLWPRLEKLDKGKALPEEPETFVKSFKYLEDLREVDKKRVSYAGFSVGSSIALVAAEDERISEKVRALVFFGGYYDIFDYLKALSSKTSSIDDKKIAWQPNEGATNHIKEILENKGISEISVALKSEELKRYSPKENIDKFKARIFILHDKSDSYVHYFESEKVNKVLEGKVEKEFLIVNLFEHVQPKKVISLETLGEFLKLHGFLYKVLEYL